MICPQQHLPLLLNSSDPRHLHQQRNSLCLDSTPYSRSSSVNRYTHRRSYSKMTHIDENEVLALEPRNHHLANQQEKTTRGNTINEEQQTMAPSSTVLLRDHPDHLQPNRQSHSTTVFLSPQRQSICSSVDEPYYDCQQINENPFEQVQSKISTYTMTGKSLYNLQQSSSSTLSSPKSSTLSTSSSEEKGVQTTFHAVFLSKTTSSTSLSSSSSTSIQTDSLERQSALIKQQQATASSLINQFPSQKKWPHLYERLLGEQTCIYWVNYLGNH